MTASICLFVRDSEVHIKTIVSANACYTRAADGIPRKYRMNQEPKS